MEIRQAKLGDEHELIDLFNSLYQESDFLLMEPGENQMSVESQAKFIDDSLKSSAQVLFVAIERVKIIGFLGGTGGNVNRNRHSIHIGYGRIVRKTREGRRLSIT